MTSKFHDILVTDQGNCHFHKKQLSYRILYYFVVFERQVIFLLPVINSFSAKKEWHDFQICISLMKSLTYLLLSLKFSLGDVHINRFQRNAAFHIKTRHH